MLQHLSHRRMKRQLHCIDKPASMPKADWKQLVMPEKQKSHMHATGDARNPHRDGRSCQGMHTSTLDPIWKAIYMEALLTLYTESIVPGIDGHVSSTDQRTM